MLNEELKETVEREISYQLKRLKNTLMQYSELNDENLKAFSNNLIQKINLESRVLIQEICNVYTKEVLNSEFLDDIELKNKFYETDIPKVVKSKFVSYKNMNDIEVLELREINKSYATLVSIIGTATVGGIIKYVLQNKIDIPIWAILVGSLIAGGVTFFSVVPAINKSRQEKAIDEFFVELKAAWLDWLKEVEAYYLQEVENFKANLNLQEV